MGSNQDQIAERLDFVRTCLAREFYDFEIVRLCEESPLFLIPHPEKSKDKGEHIEATPMSRGTIRKSYIAKVRAQLRENKRGPEEELILAHERFLLAFRVSSQREGGPDAAGMVRANTAITRLLGLKRPQMAVPAVDEELLDEQCEAMDKMMGGEDTAPVADPPPVTE